MVRCALFGDFNEQLGTGKKFVKESLMKYGIITVAC